ncbi:PREDICTED: auxin-responsive protein SAUR21-like [Nelumbo nucifera]|uniref:Auxin-responsive protein SAUR21-like n=2 Tax=Nelumbo nucifera TaxID=4432 RepID=A0A822Z7F8_NELNU|nr:PREDICTED: auxin-responsive protein SAUR21-like [Nelumbo nucifera]DAD40483.1 TPA_asm: hypothetical protein HUJ06_014806 [Nelumbo nucifera]
MAVRVPGMVHAKEIFKRSLLRRNLLPSATMTDVPKGHFAVYVGVNEKKRFIVPISYLNHPSFQDLLNKAEEEFGFKHPTGGLTIPCKEETFIGLASQLSG